MRFISALFSSFLFASAALPMDSSGERVQPRIPDRVAQSSFGASKAGAILDKPANTFRSVSAIFTVPTELPGENGSAASIWVSIGGDTYPGVILRTGVDLTVDKNGPSFIPWNQWYPADKQYYDSVSISAGHTIKLNVTSLSETSGLARVENLSNNESNEQHLRSSSALCGRSAQWIVGASETGGDPHPLANFGTVIFLAATAIGTERSYTPADGAAIVEIVEDGLLRTSTLINGSSVSVSYQ